LRLRSVEPFREHIARIQGYLSDMDIFEACQHDKLETVRRYIERGEDLNQQDEVHDHTPLMRACRWNRLGVARLLITHGADINIINEDGITALHLACSHGYTQVVKLLIEHGADVTPDALDYTPLDYAMKLSPFHPRREEIIDLFRQHHPEMVMEAFCAMSPGGMR